MDDIKHEMKRKVVWRMKWASPEQERVKRLTLVPSGKPVAPHPLASHPLLLASMYVVELTGVETCLCFSDRAVLFIELRQNGSPSKTTSKTAAA